MKLSIGRLSAAAVLAGSLACATGAPPAPAGPSPDGADLEAVMDAIQQSLSEAQTQDIAGFPALKTVTVKLQTEASRSAGGEIGLYVFSVGSRYAAEAVSTLELRMNPPERPPDKKILPPGELKQALARAIHLARIGVLKAASGTPPFVMTDIEINLKFAVELGGSAGAKVNLVPLGAEASGKLNRNQVHTITLVFGR